MVYSIQKMTGPRVYGGKTSVLEAKEAKERVKKTGRGKGEGCQGHTELMRVMDEG